MYGVYWQSFGHHGTSIDGWCGDKHETREAAEAAAREERAALSPHAAETVFTVAPLCPTCDRFPRTPGERCCPTDDTLARGWAYFENPTVALAFWSRLANQQGYAVTLPEIRSGADILDWARRVIAASDETEGIDAPLARAREANGQVYLTWRGTWTPNRWVRLQTDREATMLHLEWCTGTGRPSRFLAIEQLLADGSCIDYGAVVETETAT